MTNPEIPNTLTARGLVQKIEGLRGALTFVGAGPAWNAIADEIVEAQDALRAECARHQAAVAKMPRVTLGRIA